MYYSIRWERVQTRKNIIQVRITFLDEEGQERSVLKVYEGWIGVCTNCIDKVVQSIQHHFPGQKVLYKRLGNAKKILPYFEDRLARGKLDYRSKPFYKVYTTACIKNIGRFFNRYKFSYYDPDDWLIRIYIDLCSQYNTFSFYYQWYDVGPSPLLLQSLHMVPDRKDAPNWTFAAFDLESVSLEGHHIPMGYHPSDRIVMMSLYKWNQHHVQKWLLYVLPDGIDQPLPEYALGFKTEVDMLIHFHALLENVQIITGYNINSFDFPCIFSRLLWLKMYPLLQGYRSFNVGTTIVVSYKQKLTLDLYAYVKTFSHYDCGTYKLDDVARAKLKGETKVQVKSTGIASWYRHSPLPRDLFEEECVERCFERLRPETLHQPSQFGTFRMYLDYCLKDSELVHLIFQKEHVLSFLIVRANFTALNAMEALHFGNSRYLLELFKTYGTRLGYFIHPKFFTLDDSKHQCLLQNQKTYQGALNFCYPQRIFEDVSVMDFASMYPSTLLSNNLCYGTCTILTRDEWLATPAVHSFTAIPYRHHSGLDFKQKMPTESCFSYPTWDPQRDEFVMVINRQTEAFLPKIVHHFIQLRQYHQREWKKTRDVYHYNVQLGIKILINSLYGVMANKDSPLAYIAIAIITVTLCRYQLLGSFHFLKNAQYNVCYADTDSLMVHRWPKDHCDMVNAFLNLPHIKIQFEQRVQRLLILSKKRYVYQQSDQKDKELKGFQKKANGLIKFMTKAILDDVWATLFGLRTEPFKVNPYTEGWLVWVDTLLKANYMCRDPQKYSIYRKMKKLEDYKSTACAAMKYLAKYPDRTDEYVEFVYSRADVAAEELSNWIMDVEECRWVNVQQLFMSQKKTLCTLLNMTYWFLPDPKRPTDMVLNTLHWKHFVHAELLHWHATGRHLLLLVEPSIKYTFEINDHVKKERKRGRKRKINLGLEEEENETR